MIMKVEEVCLWMMEGRYLEDWMERKEEGLEDGKKGRT
jgi:hypothetical protein